MAAEAPYVETFRRDADLRNAAYAAALVRHGMPAAEAAAAHERGRAVDLHTHDTPLGVRWQGGERIAVGAGEAIVVAAPGHTPGSMLLAADTNHLVTGDTLLEHITSNAIELLDADRGRYRQYLQTLDRLRRYVGCTALPGHGPAFAVTEAVLDAHAAKHERRRARVLAALDAPHSAYALLPRVLPHLAHGQAFLGMCEVVGHLHALALDGEVRERKTPAGIVFARAG
jgi:glyoxylase-like metal-dependent hydrolase (beta-lactamase superfamily II)